jgi:hypothetical protein
MAVRPLSTIRRVRTRWLIVGWLPRSAITVCVGDEGIGKSLWWVLVIAALTTGRPMPEIGLGARDPIDVLVVLTEDTADEVISRLTYAGADIDRVHLMSESDDGSGSPVFPGDGNVLEAALAQHRDEGHPIGLIVLDAWLDTLRGDLRVRDPQEARQALRPWHTMATRYDLSVLLISHTNRTDSGSTRDKYAATSALRQKARMALYAARSPGDADGWMYIGPDKANGTAIRNAVTYRREVEQVRPRTPDDEGTVARLVQVGSAAAPIADLVAQWRSDEQRTAHPSADDRVDSWMRDYLNRNGGDVLADDAKRDAHQAGHNPERLAAAVKRLDGGRVGPVEAGGPWHYRLLTGLVSG